MKLKPVLFAVLFLAGCTSNTDERKKNHAKNTTNMDVTIGNRNKETVRKFFSLLEKEDINAFISLFSTDGRQINPYASGLFPPGANGKKELKEYWEPVPENFDGMRFPIQEIYAMEDPSMVFVKYTGKIKLKNKAGYYENEYYSTFKFDESGKILEYVEIFNPIVAAKGFGLLEQIKND